MNRSFVWPLLLLLAGCQPPTSSKGPTPAPTDFKTLDQGWNDFQSRWFHHLANQGSHLVPYSWYLALEQEADQTLFNADNHIQKLRFLKDPVDANSNPDGLPVGFV